MIQQKYKHISPSTKSNNFAFCCFKLNLQFCYQHSIVCHGLFYYKISNFVMFK